MPSQFDQYFLPQTDYIPEYQGMPLAQIESSAKRLEDTYLKNLAVSSQLDILNAERRSVEGDITLNEQVGQEYEGIIDQMAKEGNYEQMTGRLSALARQYSRDPRIKAIQESRANFDMEQKIAQELKAKGQTPLFQGDPSTHKSYDPKTGQANIYRPQVESMLEYDTRRASIWQTLNPDQYITGLSQSEKSKLGDVVDQYLNYGMSKGIFGEKIAQNLDNVVNAYMTTPEARQELKKLQWEGRSPEEAMKQIRTEVLDRGELRQYVQRSVQNLRPEDFGEKPIEGTLTRDVYNRMTGQTVPTPGTADAASLQYVIMNDIDPEKVKKLSEATMLLEGMDPDKYLNDARAQAANNLIPFKQGKVDIERIREYMIAEATITQDQGLLDRVKDLSVEEFTAADLDKAISYTQRISDRMEHPAYSSFRYTKQPADKSDSAGETRRKADRDAILADYGNRSFFHPETGKKFVGNDTESLKEFTEDFSKMTMTGEVDPKNYIGFGEDTKAFANAWSIQVKDEEGDPTNLLVTKQASEIENNPQAIKNQNVQKIYQNFNLTPNIPTIVEVHGIQVGGMSDHESGNILVNELDGEILETPLVFATPEQLEVAIYFYSHPEQIPQTQ